MHIYNFLHTLVFGRHVDWFLTPDIMTGATGHISEDDWHTDFICCADGFNMESLDHMGDLFPVFVGFWGAFILFSITALLICIPTNNVQAPHSPHHLLFLSF